MLPKNEHKMNIWQGKFPHENLKSDGYESTAPVGKIKILLKQITFSYKQIISQIRLILLNKMHLA